MKKVYTIVVTYNGIKWIDRCLKSLVNSTHATSIIVIDNGSSDETVYFIKSNFNGVQIIETGKNLGFGQANNWGMGEAIKNNADYIFLLNQDAWVEPDSLSSMVQVHEANTVCGIVSPIHLNGDGTALDAYFLKYLVQSDIEEYLSANILNEKSAAHVIETSFVNAAGWLLSKDCIKRIGGFDPIFFHYGEDRNYTQRVIYHGFKILIDTRSQIFHDRELRIAKVTDVKSQFKTDWINDLNYFCDIHNGKHELLILKRILKYCLLLVVNVGKWNRSKCEYYFKMLKNIVRSLTRISKSRKTSLEKGSMPYINLLT